MAGNVHRYLLRSLLFYALPGFALFVLIFIIVLGAALVRWLIS